MHKIVVNFAIKNGQILGRFENGIYFLKNKNLEVIDFSLGKTARNGLNMLKKDKRSK